MKQKKSTSYGFRKFVQKSASANFGRKNFTGNKKVTNWSLTTFKGKISVSIVVFKFVQLREKVHSY